MRPTAITEPTLKPLEIVFDLLPRSAHPRLLELFFQIYYPTTRNRQGDDVATSYPLRLSSTRATNRSGSPKTRSLMLKLQAVAGRSGDGGFPGRPFWEAQPEHQAYLEKNPVATPAISSDLIGSFRPGRTPFEFVLAPQKGAYGSATMGPDEGVMLTYCLD